MLNKKLLNILINNYILDNLGATYMAENQSVDKYVNIVNGVLYAKISIRRG